MDFLPGLDSEFLSKLVESDLARQVFLFTLAAWIHSGRVKKEIKTQFQSLTDAISHAESTFTTKIDGLDTRVKIVEQVLKTRNKES